MKNFIRTIFESGQQEFDFGFPNKKQFSMSKELLRRTTDEIDASFKSRNVTLLIDELLRLNKGSVLNGVEISEQEWGILVHLECGGMFGHITLVYSGNKSLYLCGIYREEEIGDLLLEDRKYLFHLKAQLNNEEITQEEYTEKTNEFYDNLPVSCEITYIIKDIEKKAPRMFETFQVWEEDSKKEGSFSKYDTYIWDNTFEDLKDEVYLLINENFKFPEYVIIR